MVDIITKSMIDAAGNDIVISVGKHTDTGKFHGMMYVNHPTPSGSARYLLVLSDNRGWDDIETAEVEFKKTTNQKWNY